MEARFEVRGVLDYPVVESLAEFQSQARLILAEKS